jgi:hypothetical protein
MHKLILILIIVSSHSFAQTINCSQDQPPIRFGNEDRTIIANGTSNGNSYDGTFEHLQGMDRTNPWPGVFGHLISLSLSRFQYISTAFNSNNNDYLARIQLSSSGNFEGPPSRTATIVISECPGDFNVHLNQDKCRSIGGGAPSIRWATNATADPEKYCLLEKNKVYYLNMVHSDNSENNNFDTSDCHNSYSYCGIAAIQIKER